MKRRLPSDAFEYYFSLGLERSYAAVAEHFRVSKGTVTRRAADECWQGRISELERKARQTFEKKALNELDAVRERHLAGSRLLQAKALEALKILPPGKAIRAAGALNVAWKHELLILGEPTERQATVEEIIKREYAEWMTTGGKSNGELDEEG